MRRNKKQEYLNGLNFDLEYFKSSRQRLESTNKLGLIWYLGERHTLSDLKKNIKEIMLEIRTIESDKNYKPWKSILN